MDGERSRFLMRLRIVPLPSAVIASLAFRLAASLTGYGLSLSPDSRPAAAVMLPAGFRLRTELVDGLRFCRCCTAS